MGVRRGSALNVALSNCSEACNCNGPERLIRSLYGKAYGSCKRQLFGQSGRSRMVWQLLLSGSARMASTPLLTGTLPTEALNPRDTIRVIANLPAERRRSRSTIHPSEFKAAIV